MAPIRLTPGRRSAPAPRGTGRPTLRGPEQQAPAPAAVQQAPAAAPLLQQQTLLQLQRVHGNRAVGRLLAPAAQRPQAQSARLHILQRIEDFDTWKLSYSGPKGKEAETWVKQAVAEFKTLYRAFTGAEITGATKSEEIPKAVRKTVTTFRDLCSEATAGKAAAFPPIAELLAKLTLSVSAKATSKATPLFQREETSHHIFSFLPITTLVAVRATNRYLRYLADTTIVFGMYLPDLSARLYVTLQDVTGKMRGMTMAGYHGSSQEDAPSLYKGITPRKEKDRVYKTSQLGTGFYLTEGKGGKKYAKTVAKERSDMTKTDAVVFRVFLRLEGVASFEVPKEQWADMEKNITPPSLERLCEQPKLLTSAIVKNEPLRQIKVNPALFQIVQILPPAEAMDTEFVPWLQAYCKEHPFDMGRLEYRTK